jgi:uncharacterized phage-associated protein
MKKNVIDNDVVVNSYYLVKKFKDNNKYITNLKLQKLMYFTECLYLAFDENLKNFFDCNWLAWDYGPVCRELYDRYSNFKINEIVLDDNCFELANNLSERNKLVMDLIYVYFIDYEAFELVDITHEEDSPWSYIYKSKQNEIINKIKSRDWFKERFKDIFDSE